MAMGCKMIIAYRSQAIAHSLKSWDARRLGGWQASRPESYKAGKLLKLIG
jgi:hypothetical protein